LPLAGGTASSLGIGPLDSVGSAAAAVWSWLAEEPVVLVAAILVGVAAALLPWARRRSPIGVAVVGFAVSAASVVAGAAVASTVVVLLVWAGFALAVAAPRRA
jgi:4-hydroxybenzoate polyprenyltransferase